MTQHYLDEYLVWLRFANAGMLCKGNIISMELAVRSIPDDTAVVEIGSFCGLSTNVITFFKEIYKKKNPLFCSDRWDFEGAEQKDSFVGSSSITHVQYKAFVKETFRSNISMFSQYDMPHPIEAYSDDFFSSWEKEQKSLDIFGNEVTLGGPIGFCYIDGNHTYDFAKKDFINTDKHLISGGFILFDDSGADSPWGVKDVIAEVKETGQYEVILNNPNYMFRKK